MPDPIPPPIPEGQPTIPVEETPEIITEQPAPWTSSPPPPPPAPKKSFWTTLGKIILFVGLFVAGIWLSGFIRQYFPNGLVGFTPEQQAAVTTPAATPVLTDPFASWKTYQMAGISYKLPPDVLSPICDAAPCMSQGTYLPGGTRFTIAPRGLGQLLADHRGSAISDVGGVVFTTRDATVSGHPAKEFTGTFSGKTVAGYGFNQMRGYMIDVTPVLSIEMNHFTPTGITADFAVDDTLFDQIVRTLVIPGTPSATIVPIASSTPIPATTSGY